MKAPIILTILLILLTKGQASIYQKFYKQAYSIAAAMSLEQKIGQTIQADFYAVTNKGHTDATQAIKFHFGSLLVGGDGVPDENGNMVQIPQRDEPKTVKIYANGSMQKWQKLSSKFDYSVNVTTNEGKSYSIKPLLATDAIHNNQHVTGTILFPHNIGLSCSHNPDNFYNVGKWTAKNVKESGFNYAFVPTVAVSHNPQWGRFYETMGQDDQMISQYAKSYIEGLQGKPGSLTGVLGSVKHFIGDGATMFGADQGNVHATSMSTFLKHNQKGYIGAISAEVGTVMCSYSGINWLPMAFSPLIRTYLRQKLEFDGFVISDYDELNRVMDQQLPTDFQKIKGLDESISSIFNSGIDMVMIPSKKDFEGYIDYSKAAINNGTVTEERLNDAVARILSVKLALGIAKQSGKSQQTNIRHSQQYQKSDSSQYEDSLKAVHESLVLLKNANVIPVKASALQYIVLVGQKLININNLAKYQLFKSYDNIGMQNGGWSVRWNGFEGNSQWQGKNKEQSNASSIMDALNNLKQKFELVYPNYTTETQVPEIQIQRDQYLQKLKTLRKKMNSKNTLILSVVGESPYAEFNGDVGIPYCMNETVLPKDGCMYDYMQNPYMPDQQRTSLDLQFSKFEQDVINRIREQDKNIPLLTVILAGRPMFIDKILEQSSAVLDAFLPGTSGGQGIIDAITGSYVIRPNGQSDKINSLSFDWPRNSSVLQDFPVYKSDGKVPQIVDPLFKMGYGLSSFVGLEQQ